MVRQFLQSLLFLLIAVAYVSTADARDWFVRAGATGGDGSRDQPFSDPWQALERVEANDKVHVAAGRYFGQLEAGTWDIPFPGVELLGGYDADLHRAQSLAEPERARVERRGCEPAERLAGTRQHRARSARPPAPPSTGS